MKKAAVFICVFFSIFLNGCTSIEEKFDIIEENIIASIPESINENIVLITEDLTYNATITWSSSNEEVLSSSGENKHESYNSVNVTLTYIINIKDEKRIGEIKIDVKANRFLLQLNMVEQTTVFKVRRHSNRDLELPTEDTKYNAKIEWCSSNEEVLTSNGENKNFTQDKIAVILYYKITINGYIKEGQFTTSVARNWKLSRLDEVEERITDNIPSSTIENIQLQYTGFGESVKIKWESSNPQIIDDRGRVSNFKDTPVVVTLTYTITVEDEIRIGTVQVEVPPTENYTFKLNTDYVYVGVNCEPKLQGVIYRNNQHYDYSDIKYTILGDYDLTKPGVYNLICSVEVNAKRADENGLLYMGSITLEQPFTLEVVSLEKLTMKELNGLGLIMPYNTFSVDKYFIVCYTNEIYIYDLDNENEYHKILSSGLCNSIYYKNGYLYICSRGPYGYDDTNEFFGYVTQIDLKTYTIVKEFKVDFAPYSIIIDKRNNAILSSEQQSNIKYLNMETGDISSICECMDKDIIIYNEVEDIFILIGKNRKIENKMYKYSPSNNQFILLEQQINLLKNYNLSSSVIKNYKNTWVSGVCYMTLENEDLVFQKIIKVSWEPYSYFDEINYNGEEKFVILRYDNFREVGYLIVYDKKAKSFQNYKITNYISGKYTDIHFYNNKVYLYESTTGKLYIVE